jgi:hypothetical protein
MKTIIITTGLILFALSLQAQDLNIHKTDGSVVTIAINSIDSITFTTKVRSIDEFCNAKPNGWTCEVFENSFDTLPVPQGDKGRLDNPIAIIKYINDSVTCSNLKPLYLQVYDISKKDTLEKIIAASEMYSWCIPVFFGENEKYYVITSPCYLSNGCWTEDNLKPLYQAIKGLFTKSIIK